MSTPTTTARRLGPLGKSLNGRIEQLQRQHLTKDTSAARATLARLRRGVGKPAGSVPEIWDVTLDAVPKQLAGVDGPSRAEEAAHVAMTLYALHQQSRQEGMHQPGISLGEAVGRLRFIDRNSEKAITRRFMAAATAGSVDELLTHVRGLITQLRAANRGFDYARFADDVADLLDPARAPDIRLRWGRDFYRTQADDTDSTTEE